MKLSKFYNCVKLKDNVTAIFNSLMMDGVSIDI